MDKFTYDMFYQIECPPIILSSVYHKHYGVIENIDKDSIEFSFNMNGSQEVSFDVYRDMDGHRCSLWNKIKSLRYIYIPSHHEYYKIDVTKEISDKTVKHITATSAGEYELSNKVIESLEINTEVDINRNETNDPKIPQYAANKFYNPKDPSNSILHRALSDKAPDWSIEYVDKTLCDLERTFSVSNQTVYDFLTNTIATEIRCLFKFDSVNRKISVYDLMNYCEKCGYRGEFTESCPNHIEDPQTHKWHVCGSTNIKMGYGKNTGIYISADNYASSITIDGDEGQVKNAFRVTGGDDLMDATIRNANPSGSQYIYQFSESDFEDMPEDLVEKLIAYNQKYQDAMPGYTELVDQYYHALTEYHYYKTTMMPRNNGDHWEAKTDYEKDKTCYVITLPSWCYLQCAQAGRSGNTEFDATRVTDGQIIEDGTVKWEVKKNIIEVPGAKTTHNTVIKPFLKNNKVYFDGHFYDSQSYVDRIVKNLVAIQVHPLLKVEVVEGSSRTVPALSKVGDRKNITWYGKFKITNTSKKDDTYTSETDVEATLSLCKTLEEHMKYMNDMVQKRIDRDDQTFTELWKLPPKEKEGKLTSSTTINCGFKPCYIYVNDETNDKSYVYNETISTTKYTLRERTKDEKTGNVTTKETMYPLNNVFVLNDNGFEFTKPSGSSESLDYVAKNEDDFREMLTRYSLDMLNGFAESYGGCQEVLIDQGINSLNAEFMTVELYENIYESYNMRLAYINEELVKREETVKKLYNEVKDEDTEGTPGLVQQLEARMKAINDSLNLYNEIGEDYVNILRAYIREGDYNNPNYISEGLSDTAQILDATQVLDKAKQELAKATELQYTLSDSLVNLLNDEKFAPFRDKFQLGDYIMCGDDEDLFKLRLVTLSYQFGSPTSVNVTFANATKVKNYFSDVQNVLAQASSIATSYNMVARQVEKNTDTTTEVDSWSEEGLSSSDVKISNNKKEEVIYNDSGIVIREYDEASDDYNPCQLKISRNKLMFTKDNWNSAALGLGELPYTYYDKDNKAWVQGEDYGLSAKFVNAGYISGTQIVGGEIVSDNYNEIIDEHHPTLEGSYINLRDGSFSLAGNSINGHKEGNEYKINIEMGSWQPQFGEWEVDNSGFIADNNAVLNPTRIALYGTTVSPAQIMLGQGTSDTASDIIIDGNSLRNDFQRKLTAGSNISITGTTISATDTTYSDFTGTDGTTDGTHGLVPAPTTTDIDFFLKGDGTWSTITPNDDLTLASSTWDGTNASLKDTITDILGRLDNLEQQQP